MMKNKNNLFLVFIIAVMWIIAALVYRNLPEQIPIHWNSAGEVDNYAGKIFVFMPPLIAMAVAILLKVLPKADPKHENYEKFRNSYELFGVFFCAFFLVLEVVIIYATFYPEVSLVDKVVPFMVGLLFMIIGNMMPKFKSNYFIGVKTPWTLANEDVWYQTHRLAGKLWFFCGLILAVIAFIDFAMIKTILLILLILLMVIVPSLYSYIAFKKLEKKQ